jgi:D-glycero-D-manno-heptose 1,7-bisphosphate phosphatase
MLTAELGLDAVYVCWHDNADACACRKPQPGLLLQAAADLDVDLRASYMVGDRWRDIEAGRRAGCTTIQVEDCYGEQSDVVPDKRVRSLKEAAEWIVARDGCR